MRTMLYHPHIDQRGEGEGLLLVQEAWCSFFWKEREGVNGEIWMVETSAGRGQQKGPSLM